MSHKYPFKSNASGGYNVGAKNPFATVRVSGSHLQNQNAKPYNPQAKQNVKSL